MIGLQPEEPGSAGQRRGPDQERGPDHDRGVPDQPGTMDAIVLETRQSKRRRRHDRAEHRRGRPGRYFLHRARGRSADHAQGRRSSRRSRLGAGEVTHDAQRLQGLDRGSWHGHPDGRGRSHVPRTGRGSDQYRGDHHQPDQDFRSRAPRSGDESAPRPSTANSNWINHPATGRRSAITPAVPPHSRARRCRGPLAADGRPDHRRRPLDESQGRDHDLSGARHPGICAEVFEAVAAEEIMVDMIVQSIGPRRTGQPQLHGPAGLGPRCR